MATRATASFGEGVTLAARYALVRSFSVELCEPLAIEDFGLQSMPEASPPKWHLAHTTWFFETFLLKPELGSAWRPYHPAFEAMFNSYYNSVGDPYPRPQRGLLSRPTVTEVLDWRRRVDEQMSEMLEGADAGTLTRLVPLVELGLQHERQHQELLLTDLKHGLSHNPLYPAYRPGDLPQIEETAPLRWGRFEEGLVTIGAEAGTSTRPGGFVFDNETPRHRVFQQPFDLANRLVTNEEYLAFVEDDGYERVDLWLSDGWARKEREGWRAPLYWTDTHGPWHQFTLYGLHPLDPASPVHHVSLYEADAFARWAGARLPREQEWERAAAPRPVRGNLVERDVLAPRPPAPSAEDKDAIHQLFGDVWEWTASPYVAYPGYRPLPGALGEYNGKFMADQWVLRGGSCATSRQQVSATYRNFFPAWARWQFSGIRLARDIEEDTEGERGKSR